MDKPPMAVLLVLWSVLAFGCFGIGVTLSQEYLSLGKLVDGLGGLCVALFLSIGGGMIGGGVGVVAGFRSDARCFLTGFIATLLCAFLYPAYVFIA